MSISRRVNYYSKCSLKIRFLNLINKVALVVRLEKYRSYSTTLAMLFYDSYQLLIAAFAINFRLANSKHINIWSVNYINLHAFTSGIYILDYLICRHRRAAICVYSHVCYGRVDSISFVESFFNSLCRACKRS